MRILAIETTETAGSVSLLNGEQIVSSCDLDSTARSAVSLAPGIAAALQEVDWTPQSVQLVAVANGPGSFTGLRVGVTTAKMFAYAVRCEVMGVNTLEAIAWQAPAEVGQLWTVLDGQREQLFAAQFVRSAAGDWQRLREGMLIDNDAWLAQLSTGQANSFAVSGPGLVKIADRIPQGVHVIDRQAWSPKAVTVGQIAWRQYQAGQREELGSLAPQYFRPSAAEEKRAAT